MSTDVQVVVAILILIKRVMVDTITANIAGLTNLVSILLKLRVKEKVSILENITGPIRLLSDLQHEENSIRKSLIVKNIDTKLRDTLKLTSPREWLFGKNLTEKIKNANVWKPTA